MIDWNGQFTEVRLPDTQLRDYLISIAALSYCVFYFPLGKAELTTGILRSLIDTGPSWNGATTERSLTALNSCLDTLNDGVEAFEDDVDAGNETVVVVNFLGLWIIGQLLGRAAETELEIQLGIEIGIQIMATMDKPWDAT